jgi:hypothetical protein
MNYSAWWSGAYGDVGFSFRDDGEDHTVSCLTCGEELPAHFEDGELVADEACECEDEEEPIEDPTLAPATAAVDEPAVSEPDPAAEPAAAIDGAADAAAPEGGDAAVLPADAAVPGGDAPAPVEGAVPAGDAPPADQPPPAEPAA